jgi:hypothetical protein
MKQPVAVVSVILLHVGTAASLSAHHAFAAEFDAKKPIFLKGIVTKVEWVNPHVWIHMDVKGQSGTVEVWAVEAGSPSILFRRGVTKTALKVGAEIVVDGYQAKNGTKRANGRDMTYPDGRKLFLGSSGTGAPYELTPDALKRDGQTKK